MRLVLAETDEGRTHNLNVRTSRGWKHLLLLPRLFLGRPPWGGKIPKAQLHQRFEVVFTKRGGFTSGMWAGTSRGAQAFSKRRRRTDHDDLESKAVRAEPLVQMGELSSAWAAVALGCE